MQTKFFTFFPSGRTFLLFALFAANFFPCPSLSKEPEASFAFVFNSRRNLQNVFALYGHHSPGKNVYLLNSTKNSFCAATTEEQNDYDDEAVSIPFTTLKVEESCGSLKDYDVAFFKPVQEYRRLSLTPVKNVALAKTFEKMARKSAAITRLGSNIKSGDNDRSREDEETPLEKTAQVYKMGKLDNYIVTFMFSSPPFDPDLQVGPRVIFHKNIPYPLTGWCSYPALNAFILNGEPYVESGSYCCGCGITGRELFKIGKDKVVLIHSNYDESD